MSIMDLVCWANQQGKALRCPECGGTALRFEGTHLESEIGCLIVYFRCECSEVIPCTFAWDRGCVYFTAPGFSESSDD
jgi:hypothetical protein